MLWRRRRSPPPVVLPSLDRLAGLIERVVELVDAVSNPSPSPAPETPHGSPEGQALPAAPSAGWVAFVSSAHGYRLVDREGPPPAAGDALELEEGLFRVVRLGPSPLPLDRRRCAFLSGEEPPAEERTLDE